MLALASTYIQHTRTLTRARNDAQTRCDTFKFDERFQKYVGLAFCFKFDEAFAFKFEDKNLIPNTLVSDSLRLNSVGLVMMS